MAASPISWPPHLLTSYVGFRMAHAESLKQVQESAGAVFEDFDGHPVAAHFGDLTAEQQSLDDGAVVFDAGRRTQISLAGEDSVAFLQNMCTNEIRQLPVGEGCEAFLTSAQGRILAHVLVFREADRLVLETVPDQASPIIEHLDRYIIREKVTLGDLTARRAELLVAGPGAEKLIGGLSAASVPRDYLAHRDCRLGGLDVTVRHVALAGHGSFLLDSAAEGVADLWLTLHAAGATPAGQLVADAARIETGMPAYGRDITEKNLPQEVGRDRRAISFVKGCYIGQETVARIDALGHVNRLLSRLRFHGRDVPPAGCELTHEGKPVGHVTSAALSHGLAAPIALAYVRTGHNAPGTVLQSPVGDTTVLPPADSED